MHKCKQIIHAQQMVRLLVRRRRLATEMITRLFIIHKAKLCLTRYPFDFRMRIQNRYCMTILMQGQHKEVQFHSRILMSKFLKAKMERSAMVRVFHRHHQIVVKT